MKSTIRILLVFACLSLAFAGSDIYHQGKDAYDSGNYREAVKLLLQYLKGNPKEAEVLFAERMLSEAYAKLGDEYFNKEDYETAKEFYYAANSDKGDERIELCNRKLQEKDEFEEAKANLEKAKQDFNNGNYENVINYFRRNKSRSLYKDFKKLAEESYLKIAENLFKQKQYRAVLDTVESYESLFNYPSYRDSMRSIFNKSVQYGNLTPKSWNEAERFYPIECNLADVLFHTSKCIGKHAMLIGHILQVLPGVGFLLSSDSHITYCVYSNTNNLVDNMVVEIIVEITGTQSYNTISGGMKTVPKANVLYLKSLI